MINFRENFLRAFDFHQPEWIPVTFELSDSLWMKYGESLEAIVLQNPLIFPDYQSGSYPRQPADPFFRAYDYLKDDWGCIWQNTQPGILGQVTGHPLADWKAFQHFHPPDPREQFDWQSIGAGIKADREENRLRRGYISITQGGFFDRLQFLRGIENLMLDFATHPPQLSSLIEMVLEYNLRYDRLFLDMGLDIYHYHGDIGTQKGLMFSPHTFRKYLAPAYKAMFSACHNQGTRVSYSSDGRLLELVGDLVDCGVDMHDPQLGPSSLNEIVRTYKGKLCTMVDVDEQKIPFATPAELDELVGNVVVAMRDPQGGFMIYLSCYHDTPLENIAALCRALNAYCFGA